MKTQINNEEEFNEAINDLGELNIKLAALKSEEKVLKALLDAYAGANNIKRQVTEKFKLTMKASPVKLYKLPGILLGDVVAKMKRDEIGKEYLYTDYNGEAIKRDKVDAETLESWGLALSEPTKHALVTAL